MSRRLTFSKLLQTIKFNHCKLLLVEKRKKKETPQVPQNENKSTLPPETPRILKDFLCVKGGF